MSKRETKIWSAQEIAFVHKAAADGLTSTQICEALGRTQGSLKGVLARLGIQIAKRGKPWTQDEQDEALCLAANGFSNVEIAARLHRSRESIAAFLGRNGILSRRISAKSLLAMPPLRPTCKDDTLRAYANTAFLIQLLRAGHTPGQGELKIEEDARVGLRFSRHLTHSPLGSSAAACVD